MNRKILIIVGVGLVAATASTLFFYSIIVDSFGLDEAENKANVVVALRDLPLRAQLRQRQPDDARALDGERNGLRDDLPAGARGGAAHFWAA